MTTATLSAASLRPGHVVRVRVPLWMMRNNKMLSREAIVTVVGTQPVAQTFSARGYAVVRESAQCLQCDQSITTAAHQKIGYCLNCAPKIGLPADFAIRQMDAAEVKKIIHESSDFTGIFQTNVTDVLNVFREPEAKPAQSITAALNKPAPARPAAPRATKPSTPASVRHVNGIIIVQSQKFSDTTYALCKGIGGGRWNPKERYWWWNASAKTALRLEQAFAGSDVDRSDVGFQALLSEAANGDKAAAIKLAAEHELPQPDGLKTKLWLHQLRAYNYAMMSSGVLLAMGMGTGKTLTTLALIDGRKAKTALVICPKAVVDVWPSEVGLHVNTPMIVCPLNDKNETVAKKVKRAKQALEDGKRLDVPVLIAINYESAMRPPFGPSYKTVKYKDRDGIERTKTELDAPGFALETQFDMAICDEIHRCGTPASTTSRFAGSLAPTVRYRIGLSGTPMQHDPLNIWGVFRFVDPTVFPTFAQFKRQYAIMGGFKNKQVVEWQNLDELSDIIADHSFHASKDVLKLPPQVFQVKYGELSADERRYYAQMENELEVDLGGVSDEEFSHYLLDDLDDVESAINEDVISDVISSSSITADNVLTKLMKLSQMTSGSIMDADGNVHEFGSSKLDLLMDTLNDIDRNEPLVIFARFRHDLERLRARLTKEGYKVAELSGRRNELKAWQQGHFDTLIVQLQSGSEGVNFTWCGDRQCKYCIFFGKDFRWEKHEQSLSRIHRPGQKETTFFITLVMTETIDEKIEKTLAQRGNLLKSVMEQRTIKHVRAEEDGYEAVEDEDDGDTA